MVPACTILLLSAAAIGTLLSELRSLHSTVTQPSAPCRVSAVPLERWDTDAPLSDGEPHTASARFGGWLYGAALFDAELFGMVAADAARAVDPQQRLVLESFRQAQMIFQARTPCHAWP